MNSRYAGRLTPSRVVTDSGVDHVRLAYHYLDAGDLDGYGSLLHAGTPWAPTWSVPGARAPGATTSPGSSPRGTV